MPVHAPWFLANTTHYNSECWAGWRDAPTCPFPKHPNRCEFHRPPVPLFHLWIPTYHPQEESEEKGRQELNQFETHHGFYHVLPLGCSDLLMDLVEVCKSSSYCIFPS